MSKLAVTALLIVGVILALVSFLLRSLSGGKYELTTSDLAFFVVPLAIAALATGRITGLDLYGLKMDFSAEWIGAANAEVSRVVTAAPPATVADAVQVFEAGQKGGMRDLQRLMESKADALEFQLGHGGYHGPAIQAYFDALSGSSQLRVVVITEQDRRLFGIFNASDLISALRVAGDDGYRQFENRLNKADEVARKKLAATPGFLAAEHAIEMGTSKRDALARMESIGTDTLPVVNAQRAFAGTVTRSKLTASLILAVTDRIEGREPGSER